MQRLPQEELATALSITQRDGEIDNQTALRIKKKLAEEFRNQLTIGIPTNEDERGLRRDFATNYGWFIRDDYVSDLT